MATTQAPAKPTIVQFSVWVLSGAALAGVLLFAFTPYSYVSLAVAAALAGLALRLRGTNRSALGLLLGVAVSLAYIAWLNRGGPGDVCTTDTGQGQTCTQEWSPWPWLAAALVVAAAAVSGFVAARREGRPARTR